MHVRASLIVGLILVGCSSSGSDPPVTPDLGADLGVDLGADVVELPDVRADSDPDEPDATEVIPSFTVVTFNTGTGPSARHDEPPDDGYTSAEAAITDEWYGNGLNWPPLIEDTRAFFDDVRPDIVVFQEIFWTGECADIPADARTGFVCEGWTDGAPTVVQQVLGEAYQVACHPGKPDKCAAVRQDFGSFRGCDGAFCLEGMTGFPVDGCGSGARVARVVIDRIDGGPLTLVNVHGSSGFTNSDVDCRIQQVDQVFGDLGDGAPAANGVANLVMGDLNTDPANLASTDASASRWQDFVGPRQMFQWHTDMGPDADPTYGVLSIDHVASDVFIGGCWHAGVTAGREPVSDIVYFDHRPAVCELSTR